MSIEINASKGIQQNTTEVTKIPVGTTAQRPDSPQAGMIRFNTDDGQVEGFDGADWVGFGAQFIQATGGTVTDITQNGKLYRVHTFTSSGTFEVSSGSGEVEYLVVGGGGGGGAGWNGGGGGAGGVLLGTTQTNVDSYLVVVGNGGINGRGDGAGNGRVPQNGQNSSVFGLISIGGGSGAQELPNKVAQNGGSGGGGVHSLLNPGSGVSGQGNNGGFGFSGSSTFVGGGGGGAGAAGQNATSSKAGNGGVGVESSIDGSTKFYGGGGGGAFRSSSNNGLGGNGGGGNGGTPTPGQNGAVNTGGGGGGGAASATNNGVGGSGGSGIVIVRYRIG